MEPSSTVTSQGGSETAELPMDFLLAGAQEANVLRKKQDEALVNLLLHSGSEQRSRDAAALTVLFVCLHWAR